VRYTSLIPSKSVVQRSILMNSASLTVPLSLSSDSGVFPARLNKLLLDYLNFIVSPHLLLDMVSYPAWGRGVYPWRGGRGGKWSLQKITHDRKLVLQYFRTEHAFTYLQCLHL